MFKFSSLLQRSLGFRQFFFFAIITATSPPPPEGVIQLPSQAAHCNAHTRRPITHQFFFFIEFPQNYVISPVPKRSTKQTKTGSRYFLKISNKLNGVIARNCWRKLVSRSFSFFRRHETQTARSRRTSHVPQQCLVRRSNGIVSIGVDGNRHSAFA